MIFTGVAAKAKGSEGAQLMLAPSLRLKVVMLLLLHLRISTTGTGTNSHNSHNFNNQNHTSHNQNQNQNIPPLEILMRFPQLLKYESLYLHFSSEYILPDQGDTTGTTGTREEGAVTAEKTPVSALWGAPKQKKHLLGTGTGNLGLGLGLC